LSHGGGHFAAAAGGQMAEDANQRRLRHFAGRLEHAPPFWRQSQRRPPRIVGGAALPAVTDVELLALLEEDGALFARYVPGEPISRGSV